MINPKVSIIIPTFNRAKYLPQAIESALAQDYPNLEVVVSDNASTDETPEVIKKYLEDSRFKYFRNTKNLGAAGNWRKALYDYTIGDWAMILSDDDYLIDYSYISKAMELIKSKENVFLVFSNYRIRDEMEDTYVDHVTPYFSGIINGKDLFWHYWTDGIGVLLCTAIFDRNKALELKAFDKDIIGPDIELFLKLSLIGEVGFIASFSAVYRVHKNSLSLDLSTREEIEKRFQNLINIKSSAQFAILNGKFSYSEITKWEKRMITYSLKSILNHILKNGSKNMLPYFTRKVVLEGKSYLKIFLDPIVLFKIIFLSGSKFYEFSRKLYIKLRSIFK